jgi:hypothetical protein
MTVLVGGEHQSVLDVMTRRYHGFRHTGENILFAPPFGWVRPAYSSAFQPREDAMVLCPVALAVGCKACPVFNVCPAKGIIGDYKPDNAAPGAKESAASAGAKNKKA